VHSSGSNWRSSSTRASTVSKPGDTWQKIKAHVAFTRALLPIEAVTIQLVRLTMRGSKSSGWVTNLARQRQPARKMHPGRGYSHSIREVRLRHLQDRKPIAIQTANLCAEPVTEAYLLMPPLFFQVLLDSASTARTRLAVI
jgi:hypothetical protein